MGVSWPSSVSASVEGSASTVGQLTAHEARHFNSIRGWCAQTPQASRLYFLRRGPRGLLAPETVVNAADTWGLRSYSPPDDPRPGRAVFDCLFQGHGQRARRADVSAMVTKLMPRREGFTLIGHAHADVLAGGPFISSLAI